MDIMSFDLVTGHGDMCMGSIDTWSFRGRLFGVFAWLVLFNCTVVA